MPLKLPWELGGRVGKTSLMETGFVEGGPEAASSGAKGWGGPIRATKHPTAPGSLLALCVCVRVQARVHMCVYACACEQMYMYVYMHP